MQMSGRVKDVTEWTKTLYVKNMRRATYDMWQVPKEIRDRLGIANGFFYAIQVKFGSEVLFEGELKTTSGAEFYLSKEVQTRLRGLMEKFQNTRFLNFKLLPKSYKNLPETPQYLINDEKEQEQRLKRLKSAPKKPEKILVQVVVYNRNKDVVDAVLYRAKGKCEGCRNNAPFRRRANGSPYLEVHHKIPLSEDGDDTTENAVALCPNCHRKQHFGPIE